MVTTGAATAVTAAGKFAATCADDIPAGDKLAILVEEVVLWVGIEEVGLAHGESPADRATIAKPGARREAVAGRLAALGVQEIVFAERASGRDPSAHYYANFGYSCTDPDYWIHGAQPSQIHGTIANGVLDKGMPAWSAVLKPQQVLEAAAYVTTLHDTHPKDPKEPQGVKVEAEEASEKHE